MGVVVDTTVGEAKPVVKIVVVRQEGFAVAQVPFARHVSLIAQFFECFGYGGQVRRQAVGSDAYVAGDARGNGIASGEYAAAPGGADRGIGVPAGEFCSPRCDAVKVGGLEVGRAHAREVAVSLIVAHEYDEVGFVRHRGSF